VRITGGFPIALSVVGDSLLFVGAADDLQVMDYDLVTGTLSSVGDAGRRRGLGDPQGAGDFVLWYDPDGGHVARIPHG
jgi:hypothetical protein